MTVSISRSSHSKQHIHEAITKTSFDDLIENISRLKVFRSGTKEGRQWVTLNDHQRNQTITLEGKFKIGRDRRVNWKKSAVSHYEKKNSATGKVLMTAFDLDFAGKSLEAVARGNEKVFLDGQSFHLTGSTHADDISAKSVKNIIHSGHGNDTVIGGERNDRLSGGHGNDSLQGSTGSDTIFGGSGDDLIDGGISSDKLFGGSNHDTIFAGDGEDTVNGGRGNDEIFGNLGNDHLMGSRGDDTLRGAQGDDIISGGEGNDRIHGGKGKDKILGQEGNDIIFGGDGNDKLLGKEGDDTIHGGNGDDQIYGETGKDLLTGGSGNDVFQLKKATGHAVITDFSDGKDRIWFGIQSTGLRLVDTERKTTSNSNNASNLTNDTHIFDGDDLMAVVQNLHSSQLTFFDGYLI